MGEIKWIKLSTDIFNNRKIRQIECMPDGDTIIVIWFKILALAGEINDSGQVYLTKEIPYTDQLLSTQFNRPIATVRLALQTFQQFGMIEIIDNLILVSNWEKYQNIEGMERVREQNRLRKQAQRERERQLLQEPSRCVTGQSRDSHAVEEEKEKDKEYKERDREKEKTAKRFSPPTVEQVREYCRERKNKVDPERFVSFYQAKGWMVGKSPMKDWKAAVRNWERPGDEGRGRSAQHDAIPQTYDSAEFFDRALKKSYGGGKDG